jgi:acyl-CoA hydrolase
LSAARLQDCEACVDLILERLGKRIVLGTPLGIGKPNALINALYRRAKADASISLDIVTALSLNPPLGKSELEERFLAPIRERVWPHYPRLEYLDDLTARRLPANIRVIEFYMRAASQLGNPLAQQDYISSNYTHAARDIVARGTNLILQAVALRDDAGRRRYSLSSNPDVTLEILPHLRDSGRPWLMVAQVNRRMPWFGGAAEVDEDTFHCVIDNPELDHEPFAAPHDPVEPGDWAVGLRTSALVRDGGTLQVGIGALGDAVCHALRLRDRENAAYRTMLDALGVSDANDTIGGREPFAQGLYVASELISHALFSLFEDGIVRRRVYEDEDAQAAANAGRPPPTGGTAMQGAFFVGPGAFYRALRDLPEERRALVDMTGVAEVNRVFTHYRLERLQRRHPRFVNISMKATLLGAAISDQLADGQVVSGVGGQHDFVVMAHQLPEGRSILVLRATHGSGAKLSSNIVWEYPHATIPRHERDLFVTEYGVADLRGKTDRECCEAMLAIADSRFQDSLAQEARNAGKLPPDYRVPTELHNNYPERVEAPLKTYLHSGMLPVLPFGHDFTDAELAIVKRLRGLQAAAASWGGRLKLLHALAVPARADREDVRFALQHLRLDRPATPAERRLAWLVRAAYSL